MGTSGAFFVDWGLLDVSIDAVEFIYNAVDAGWTTPRIARECDDVKPGLVYAIAKQARQEGRDRLKTCEHCRRNIATGKREGGAA